MYKAMDRTTNCFVALKKINQEQEKHGVACEMRLNLYLVPEDGAERNRDPEGAVTPEYR